MRIFKTFNLYLYYCYTDNLKWILTVFVVWIRACYGEVSQHQFRKTSSVPGSLVGTPYFSVSKVGCSALCSTNPCESFTFHPKTGECLMYHGQLHGNNTPVPDMEHYILMEPESGQCLRDSDCDAIPSAVCDDGTCQCPLNFTFISDRNICVSDCLSLYDAGFTSDGIYEIQPDGVTSVNVLCDMTEGGWTLFQQRYNGDVNFHEATWNQSAEGFGDPNGDHWLGLNYVNMLTWTANEIYFELTLINNTMVYFHHTNFTVANSSSMFLMKVSQDYKSNLFSPSEYEGFYRHDNKYFTTRDQDNDESATKNCAVNLGPWWLINCGIFGLFNDEFHQMRIARTPPLDEPIYFSKCRIKIRRY